MINTILKTEFFFVLVIVIIMGLSLLKTYVIKVIEPIESKPYSRKLYNETDDSPFPLLSFPFLTTYQSAPTIH